MDPRKVQAVTNWPTPTNVKAFGICKFLSQVCMELQCSSSSSLSPHQRENWSSEPKEAFKELKRHFTTVPILTLPDPNKPFVVEVYGSDVGVGAILSQRGVDNKHHLCAFLSHRLSPAERNYDEGDWELLVVKLALEVWRHWLERSQHQFLVLIDHKNLEYIQQAKQLNPRQVRWSLFFNHLFHFVLSSRIHEFETRLPVSSFLTHWSRGASRSHHY